VVFIKAGEIREHFKNLWTFMIIIIILRKIGYVCNMTQYCVAAAKFPVIAAAITSLMTLAFIHSKHKRQ